MLSRRKRVALLALVTALSMVNVIDRVEAQTGSVRIATDLELLGLGGPSGGGHVSGTHTGREAQGLRAKILDMVDWYRAITSGLAHCGMVAARSAFFGG